MAPQLCDVCGVRPATVRAEVVSSDGERQVLNLCDVDYRRLARQQRSSSPLESLFGGRRSLFDDFFGDDFFGGGLGEREAGERQIPVRSGAGTSPEGAGA
jgi:ATP-dependent Clp protease ATP-binding subunit ClpC